MGFAPTPEQDAIRKAACVEQDLLIEAGAGTGKTSTLRLLGNDQPNDRHLYIAYNKAIQVEADASFPANVRCRTAHSLAYGGTIGRYGIRVSGARLGGIQSSELLRQLRITKSFDIGTDKPLEPKTLAEMVARTLTRYTTTGDRELTAFHAPRPVGVDDEDVSTDLRAYLAEQANKAWGDYVTPKGKLTFTPNIYLKLWQLSNPKLRFDTIFFDEAQDANGAMADVVNRQRNLKRRAVGDRCQALYEWNGAVDAMARWDWPRLMLTRSFRFGPAIAELANQWLDYLDADLRLSGLEAINSQVCDEIELPDAVLCRTNMGVVDAALTWLARGRSVAVVGGIGEAARLARAAADLRSGRGTDHPDLAAFTDWDEFTYFVKTDPDGEDYKVLVNLIETYGTDAILSLQRRLCDNEADADVVISTGHKSKGREWDAVEIGADFAPRDSDDELGDQPMFTRAQAMLIYVAITRAKLAVCLGPLAGVL